ncbi:MAG: DUF4374 domain-containing protein [Sporocytophaga sp.]|nr:DUF4374 domain-containing protein [Sporocytophaga sp.]
MFKIYRAIVAVACIGLVFSACTKKEDQDVAPADTTNIYRGTKYIITATPTASTGVADYLLSVDDPTTGTISTAGNGVEQDGTYRYYTVHKGKFFSLLYGQGNPGAVATYRFNKQGKLEKISDFVSETVQVFANVGDDILTMKVPRQGDNKTAYMYRINADLSQIVDTKTIDVVNLSGNGERAHFTWAKQVGNKVFAPYMSIRGCCSDAFGTSNPDSAYIAVFSYPDLTLEKVIKDNRTSYIGAYFNDGLALDERGDVYAFSPAAATYETVVKSTTKSAFVRIPAGTTSFDNYYFDVETASGGHHIRQQTYIGNGKILLNMYGDAGKISGGPKLAIADLYNKTFTWISGLPAEIVSMSTPYNNNTVSSDKGKIYVGINAADGSWIYVVDVNSASATKGMTVEGGKITSIVKVTN